MSRKEIDRLDLVQRVLERRLTQRRAGRLMQVSARQVRRWCVAYERHGAKGLVSGRRGKPSDRRLPEGLRKRVIELVREHYEDFGPTLAREKLWEWHELSVGRETLRKWMAAAGLWVPQAQRTPRPHSPRHRRECHGELVQIEGSPHDWFEGRGPKCTLLVYVDDATGRLMELQFVPSETAFDYFRSTRRYLERYGKPVTFCSDKHSVFRAYTDGATGRFKGVTQFGRALSELNLDPRYDSLVSPNQRYSIPDTSRSTFPVTPHELAAVLGYPEHVALLSRVRSPHGTAPPCIQDALILELGVPVGRVDGA